MENKLEQLLNSLIERGRCPFGKKDVFIETGEGYDFEAGWIILKKEEGGTYTCESKYMPYRMLCTKSSGLWQFVCENGMVNVDETEVYYFWLKRKGTLDRGHYYLSEAGEDIRTNNFEYRLIESSLKDESELEDFLLSNIKVEGEGQKHS